MSERTETLQRRAEISAGVLPKKKFGLDAGDVVRDLGEMCGDRFHVEGHLSVGICRLCSSVALTSPGVYDVVP